MSLEGSERIFSGGTIFHSANKVKRKNVILAIGDSVTQGVPYVPPEETYPEMIGLMSGDEVINLGIGGITVAEMAIDIQTHLDRHKPAAVIFSGGGNDIDYGRSAEDVRRDLDEIALTIEKAGAHLVLCTVTPSSLSGEDEVSRSKINDWIRSNGQGRWFLADIDGLLRDRSDPSMLSAAYDSGDGVHPNAKGMRAIADEIAGVLRDIRGSGR